MSEWLNRLKEHEDGPVIAGAFAILAKTNLTPGQIVKGVMTARRAQAAAPTTEDE